MDFCWHCHLFNRYLYFLVDFSCHCHLFNSYNFVGDLCCYCHLFNGIFCSILFLPLPSILLQIFVANATHRYSFYLFAKFCCHCLLWVFNIFNCGFFYRCTVKCAFFSEPAVRRRPGSFGRELQLWKRLSIVFWPFLIKFIQCCESELVNLQIQAVHFGNSEVKNVKNLITTKIKLQKTVLRSRTVPPVPELERNCKNYKKIKF